MGKGEHSPTGGSPEWGMTRGCHTHREEEQWQNFYNMTSLLRKSRSSQEVDGSQMKKLRSREKVICPGPSFSLLTPGPTMYQEPPGRTRHARLDGLPKEAGDEGCPAPSRVIVGCIFCPPPHFASVHCPEAGHQVVGSQSPDHGTLGPKTAPSPSEADGEQHSALLAQSSGLSHGGLARQ